MKIRRIHVLAIGIAVSCSSLLFAQPIAVPAPFTANVLIVKSHDDIASWVLLPSAKRLADTGHARKVTRGVKFYLPVVATFSDSQVGQNIDLRGVIQIVSPMGNTFFATRCFANQVDPRAPRTIVLEPVLDLTFDNTDPGGDYRIRASIHRGNEVAVVSETFHLE